MPAPAAAPVVKIKDPAADPAAGAPVEMLTEPDDPAALLPDAIITVPDTADDEVTDADDTDVIPDAD